MTLDDLMAFYKEKMLRSDDDDVYQDLSLEGFHCIQSFFVLLNGISGKLIRLTEHYGQYKGKHLKVAEADQKPTNEAGTGTAAGTSTAEGTATAIEYNANTGKLTSYSSEGVAAYTPYSWTGGAQGASQTTGTATAPVYGPMPKQKSPVDGYKTSAET